MPALDLIRPFSDGHGVIASVNDGFAREQNYRHIYVASDPSRRIQMM